MHPRSYLPFFKCSLDVRPNRNTPSVSETIRDRWPKFEAVLLFRVSVWGSQSRHEKYKERGLKELHLSSLPVWLVSFSLPVCCSLRWFKKQLLHTCSAQVQASLLACVYWHCRLYPWAKYSIPRSFGGLLWANLSAEAAGGHEKENPSRHHWLISALPEMWNEKCETWITLC